MSPFEPVVGSGVGEGPGNHYGLIRDPLSPGSGDRMESEQDMAAPEMRLAVFGAVGSSVTIGLHACSASPCTHRPGAPPWIRSGFHS